MKRIELGYNNVYLVQATASVLIDAGPDYRGASETLLTAMTAYPAEVVVTHGHLDHAGLSRWWQERGVPVSLGRGDEHFASTPQFGDEREFAAFERFVRGVGAPQDVADEVVDGLRQRRQWAHAAASPSVSYGLAAGAGRWPTQLRYPHFVPDRLLADGDGAQARLQVISCPGHTPGNIVLVEPGEGWLFSGDQLLPEITPTPGVQRGAGPLAAGNWRFASLPRFLDSLRRLAAMRFSYCWPGHGEPFADVTPTIELNIAQIEQRTDRVLKMMSTVGGTTVYDLCRLAYPRGLARRFWQIVSTVQGHLDILEERGLVHERNGLYERAP